VGDQARGDDVTTPPLVPPETMAMVGAALGQPVTAVITRREAQRYARAVGDLNPIYFDEEAARDAGYDGLVAPPTFVGHAVVEGGALGDLREDGLWVDRGRKVRLGVSRSMFGGEEWELRGPVLVGDTVTAQRRLGAVEEKDGRSGPFVLLHYETTFTNQRDEVVAVSRLVGIARGVAPASATSWPAPNCRPSCATRRAPSCSCTARRRTTRTASTTTATTRSPRAIRT
jgi:acyl dehydratase